MISTARKSDPLHVALQFLHIIAKEAANRHIAAAMTSALFNLVLNHQRSDGHVPESLPGDIPKPNTAVIYLENLVPPPPDTTAVVPPPTVSIATETKIPVPCTEKYCFAEYYASNSKTVDAIWEPLYTNFTYERLAPINPTPTTARTDADSMKTRLEELDHELFIIDGPPHTWNFKKSLRRRVQQCRDKIQSARTLNSLSGSDCEKDLWIPLKLSEAIVGDRLYVFSAYFDDSEPRCQLTHGTQGYIKNIDKDGDFEICLDNGASSWLYHDNRSASLLRRTCMESIVQEFGCIDADALNWKMQATET